MASHLHEFAPVAHLEPPVTDKTTTQRDVFRRARWNQANRLVHCL
jgi:hypothetical protein